MKKPIYYRFSKEMTRDKIEELVKKSIKIPIIIACYPYQQDWVESCIVENGLTGKEQITLIVTYDKLEEFKEKWRGQWG